MPDTAFEELLAIEPGDPPTLSVYLDMRPQETGENPGLRHSLIELTVCGQSRKASGLAARPSTPSRPTPHASRTT